MNWVRVYNRLLEIIDPGDDQHPNYFSGRRFIDTVGEIDNYHATYSQYMSEMKSSGLMKSRKEYFIDILEGFTVKDRIEIIRSVLSKCRAVDDLILDIEDEMGILSKGIGETKSKEDSIRSIEPEKEEGSTSDEFLVN